MVGRFQPDRGRTARDASANSPRPPLLVVDGDSFAHRAYHGLPKSIRRAGNKGGGAIVGFANTCCASTSRSSRGAVLVGWDTLEAPTYRHQVFPAYQARPRLRRRAARPARRAAAVRARPAASPPPRRPATRRTTSWPPRPPTRGTRGGTALVASGDRDAFQLASRPDHDPAPGARRRDRPDRTGRGARALRGRARAGARLHRAARRSVRQAARRARRRAEDGGEPAAALRRRLEALLADGQFAGAGRRPPPLQADRHHGRHGAAARDPEPAADLAGGGAPCRGVGARPPSERLEGFAAEARPRPRAARRTAGPSRSRPSTSTTSIVGWRTCWPGSRGPSPTWSACRS